VVSVSSAFGQVAYSGFPRFGEFRTNWTIGASASMPIFTGGRLKADEITARANLIESQARLQQTKELATLEEASTRLQLANARAAWESTAGIVQQAQRAYEIAELRYREGLSTQLELSDARLLLEQARNQRAVAAAAVQLARVRLVLLPELPVSAGAAAAAAPQQQTTQQQTTVSTPAATAAPAASTRTGSPQQ
jgi:outer membrane protein TolC